MWWFLIYALISFLVYTFTYYYIFNEIEFPSDITESVRDIIVVIGAFLTGLFWPVGLIYGLIISIKEYKNK